MKIVLAALILMSTTGSAFAQECIGSEKAKHFLVYLHGTHTKKADPQELKNREILKDLAKKLDLRIALPRATNSCPNKPDQICWGWDFNDTKTVLSSLEAARTAAKKCFDQSSDVILLGFSNGGFVINRIIQDCLKTPFSKFISIAASGSWRTEKKKDLSSCGPLIMLIGTSDSSNYVTVKEYQSWLAKNKADVKLFEFSGGHEIPEKELEQILINLR